MRSNCKKNRSHCTKMGYILKKELHCQKWDVFGKNGSVWKNLSHLEKGSHSEKLAQVVKRIGFLNVTCGKMGHTVKNGSYLEKLVTLRRIGHIWKNVSHWVKWVTYFSQCDPLFQIWPTFLTWTIFFFWPTLSQCATFFEKWPFFKVHYRLEQDHSLAISARITDKEVDWWMLE